MSPLQGALLIAAALTLLAACVLWRGGMRGRNEAGLPRGQVVYSDMDRWQPAATLYAPRHNLAGRPDYLLERRGRLIPIEVKPGRRAPAPYASDVLQLAAYCLLVAEETDRRPPYGLLRYAEETFRIPYTRQLENRLLDTLERMRLDAADDLAPPRSHDDPVRCRFCGQAAHCDECLAD